MPRRFDSKKLSRRFDAPAFVTASMPDRCIDLFGNPLIGKATFPLGPEDTHFADVVRVSDNAPATIQFINGVIDPAVVTFAGASSVVIAETKPIHPGALVWSQSNPSLRPFLVKDGVLQTDGGLPAIRFEGGRHLQATLSPAIGTFPATFLAVAKSDVSTNAVGILNLANTADSLSHGLYFNSDANIRMHSSSAGAAGQAATPYAANVRRTISGTEKVSGGNSIRTIRTPSAGLVSPAAAAVAHAGNRNVAFWGALRGAGTLTLVGFSQFAAIYHGANGDQSANEVAMQTYIDGVLAGTTPLVNS